MSRFEITDETRSQVIEYEARDILEEFQVLEELYP